MQTTTRWFSIGAAGLLLAATGFAWVAWAADTLSGEVIDLACYLHDPRMKGASHRKCAETCAKKQIPMGILTEDGQVFVLLEDHDNPKAYADALAKAAQKITVVGQKVAQGGVNGIVVETAQ
jgi:hypothetical protein